jgi:hypothetical protein
MILSAEGIFSLAFIAIIGGLIVLLLPVFAILDILKVETITRSEKVLWIILIVIIPILGSIIYFVAAPRKNKT